jgi:hypothetical protein
MEHWWAGYRDVTSSLEKVVALVNGYPENLYSCKVPQWKVGIGNEA